MPQIPHWYCLKRDKMNTGDEGVAKREAEEFLWFARYIREHSAEGKFYGKVYRYFYLDGYKYWFLDERAEDCELINRDRVEALK